MEKMRQILENKTNTCVRRIVSPLVFKWTASLLQFVFVLLAAVCSGKVKTWKIGYMRGILSPDTLHLPPDTNETSTTGTRLQPEIHERGQRRSGRPEAFALHLCPKRPEQADI